MKVEVLRIFDLAQLQFTFCRTLIFMWLPIIIIALAIAMVVGPIMLMQPTQQQRRDAARRQYAAELGLRVHLQPPPEGSLLDGTVKQVAMYCLPWQEARHGRNTWCLVRRSFEHELHFLGEWDWQYKPAVTPPLELLSSDTLAQLPESVIAIASGPQGLCCYWQERGELVQVDRLSDWLKTTAKSMV